MNIAHLKEDSIWYPLFPSGCVPITNILLPNRVICEGDGDMQDVYFVDLPKLTTEQFETLVDMVHEQCDPETARNVCRAQILERGLPLRAKHVSSVSTDVPFFL